MVDTTDNNRELTFSVEPNSTNDSQLLHNQTFMGPKIRRYVKGSMLIQNTNSTILMCAAFSKIHAPLCLR